MAITISGDTPNFTSATLTTSTLTSPTITGAVVSSMASSVITSGTAVASTSGTSIDFTGLPSWVKRITVMFSDVSTNGTSQFIVQLGDSGGIEITGYTGGAGSGTSGTGNTVGYIVSANQAAATVYSGIAHISNVSGNLWVASGTTAGQAFTPTAFGGSKTLSATLDRVRITTVNGTDTFDAGTINILYE
jgi:hypothetical protein